MYVLFFIVNNKGNVALKAETNFGGHGGLKKMLAPKFSVIVTKRQA